MTDMVVGTSSELSPRSSKRKGWIAAGIAVVVVLGGVVWAISRPKTVGVTIPPADLYTVQSLSQAANITTTGTIDSTSQVSLAFQNVSGTISFIQFQVGEKVAAGQVLATLNNSTLQAQVQQAQAGVEQAKGALAQAQGGLAQAQAQYRVVTQGATPQNVAVAEAGVTSAKTALANAEKQYQAQLASYNDRTAQLEALTQAKNAVTQAQTAYQTAQQNQQSQIQAAQAALATDQNNLKVDQQNLTTDQQQYGNITLQQVQQEYAAYQTALSNYNAWQKGAYAGMNPYATTMSTDSQVYQNDYQGYYALQGAEQKVNGDQAAIQNDQKNLTGAQTAVAQAKANYDAAVKAEAVAQQAYNDRTVQNQQVVAAANAVKQAQMGVAQAETQLQQVQQPATKAQVNASATAIKTATAGVQTAEAGVTAAEAQLNTAQVNASYSVLRAPVAGTVVQKIASVGDMVAPGQPILQMDVPQLQVDLAVSDTQLPFVKVGTPIVMTVSALPGQTFKGRVVEVDPTPISGNGTEYRVKATLVNTGNTLQPGMSGNVSLQTNTTSTELAIPAMALQQVNGEYGVFVLGNAPSTSSTATATVAANLPKGAYFQPVQVGFQGTRYVEITSGLKSGEKVLLGVGRFVSPNASSD